MLDGESEDPVLSPLGTLVISVERFPFCKTRAWESLGDPQEATLTWCSRSEVEQREGQSMPGDSDAGGW